MLMSTVPTQPTITQTTLTISTPSGPLPIHVFTPTTLSPRPFPRRPPRPPRRPCVPHLRHPRTLDSPTRRPTKSPRVLGRVPPRPGTPLPRRPGRLLRRAPPPLHPRRRPQHRPRENRPRRRLSTRWSSRCPGLARARDEGLNPQPKGVVLVYPMLDDRVSVAAPGTEKALVWTLADQETGWGAYLGDQFRKDGVSIYAAPGRAKVEELKGLPPHWIDVGGLDLFAGESLRYAAGLVEAGTEVEMHLWKGVVHGFEVMAPEVAVTKRAEEGKGGGGL
ncbi:hypothetical protein KVT40_001367 [Elsinoe batatas]|uniref:Alpha/beta hydrolase fold-3 domain-containing protein n=1 Tax=Elsinoe batatas TaxID=2601811 RepID=A0A8K0L7W5_9PEZI|nr:hypothetical protein KVT40_001367 [Elsinoe batatas]